MVRRAGAKVNENGHPLVEALPSLVDELKERVAEWRRIRQFTVKTKAA